MSKIKEQLLREEEMRIEYMLSYANWLDTYLKPLSVKDIDSIEEERLRSTSKPKRTKSLSKFPSNNNIYNPKQGA